MSQQFALKRHIYGVCSLFGVVARLSTSRGIQRPPGHHGGYGRVLMAARPGGGVGTGRSPEIAVMWIHSVANPEGPARVRTYPKPPRPQQKVDTGVIQTSRPLARGRKTEY